VAAIFSAECSSCGKQHECCFAESDFVVQGREYFFECPNTGQPVMVLGPVGWHMVLQGPPSDVVKLKCER
jgi:hypothetical protein